MKEIMPFRHFFSHGAGFSAASSGGHRADGGERTS
jgi:hypothetical protein